MSIFLSPTCTWVWIPFVAAGVGEGNEVYTLHPIVEGIKADHEPYLALNAWYHDDIIMVGSPEDLADALSIKGKDGPSASKQGPVWFVYSHYVWPFQDNSHRDNCLPYNCPLTIAPAP